MRKDGFLKSLAVVAMLLVAVDVGFGLLFDRLFLGLPLRDKIPSTLCHRHSDSPEVLLIGSSRCHHHYDAALLRDALSGVWGEEVSIYNFGLDGVYVNSSLCAIESMLERYSPRLIVLDVGSHEFDTSYRNTVAIASPLYWHDKVVKRYINEANCVNKVVMLSSLYRYRDAMPFRMGEVYLTGSDSLLGYLPLQETMDTMVVYPKGPTEEEFVADTVVERSFRRVMALCLRKGVPVIVVDSPRYCPADNSNYVRQLCASCDVPFIDFYDTDFFNSHPELFYEPAHLNAQGASCFTALLSEKLRGVL